MRDGVEVGGDELAALVLVDAQLGVLDLVVVDVAVETNHHSAHVVVVLQREACALPTSLVRMRIQSTGALVKNRAQHFRRGEGANHAVCFSTLVEKIV